MATATNHEQGTEQRRRVRPRRGLPGGRAVVGGFLVAVAAVGVFAAYTSTTAGPVTRYAVVTRDLGPGDVLTTADLALVPLDLPDQLRARAFDDLGVLSGATVIAPLRADELVQASAVVDTGSVEGLRMASFAVDATRALGGDLKPGERIDVLATYGSGEQAFTVVVIADTTIVDTQVAEGAIGTATQVTFTVPVPDGDTAEALAHAASVAQLAVVRATGAGDDAYDDEPHQPAVPEGGDPDAETETEPADEETEAPASPPPAQAPAPPAAPPPEPPAAGAPAAPPAPAGPGG